MEIKHLHGEPPGVSGLALPNFLLTDQVGTLRAVADSTGTIVKRIDYDSFGNIIADSNPSFNVPFGFAGGLHDRDTGLVRFGARDYDPTIGRWTAKDPLDFGGGDTNLYGYVTNDPINLVDPLGLRVSADGLANEVLSRVRTTPMGRKLYDELNGRDVDYRILVGSFPSRFDYYSNTIYVNSCPTKKNEYLRNRRVETRVPTLEQQMAHEMGEAFHWWVDPMAPNATIITDYENPVSIPLGQGIRIPQDKDYEKRYY